MSSLEQPVLGDQACDACRRRSWLLGALVGHLEIVWQQRRPLRDVLALDDERLLAAVGGTGRGALTAAYEAFDGRAARAAEARAGTRAVCVHDPAFPTGLRTGAGAPPILHVAAGAGDPVRRLAEAMAAPVVAIVGTRRASDDALEMARALGRGLARAGVTVVSGLALGIDSAAHAGALEGGGRTVAVLAGAAEVAYPRSKVELHRRIVATGCVVSELPPACTPLRWCFPARNRIIAGLSAATVVVEGAERSGSLITADFAAQLGREVAAVPGPAVSARARGSNGLIRDGAAVVLGAEDVLDLVLGVGSYDGVGGAPGSGSTGDPSGHEGRAGRLGGARPAGGGPGPGGGGRPAGGGPASGGGGRPLRVALAPELEALLEAIGAGRRTLAALARTPGEAEAVLVGLADLEARGLVRRLPGGQWIAAVDP